jgi:hypothetical protein
MAQHRLNYHHLISQSTVSAAGPPLANAVVDAQSQLYYRYLPGSAVPTPASGCLACCGICSASQRHRRDTPLQGYRARGFYDRRTSALLRFRAGALEASCAIARG